MIQRPKRSIGRRLFLRGMVAGAAVAVGLPLFDRYLNDHGDALADGGALPTRFGLWFFGNGTRYSNWLPITNGADYALPDDPALGALMPHKEYVSVVSGLSVMVPRFPHHSGMSCVNSGGPHLKIDNVRDTIVSTMKYKSVDQVAADYYAQTGPTPYRSLEAAITRFRGTDEGTSFQYLSHNGSVNGETNVNPSEESPHNFFNRLFGQGQAAPLVTKARGSVLNAVMDQVGSLEKKLGTRDKQRLDQHLASISDLEHRLNFPIGQCVKPPDPGDYSDINGNEQIAEKNKVMCDLMALALSCQLTRAFSIMFSTCGSGVIMWPVGATDGQHYETHVQPAPYTLQHESVKFTMAQLAYLLDRFKQTVEGSKNLLDQTSILVTTEHTEGWTHSQDEMPMLICGKGGGKLRGNYHHREPGGSTTKALLTALRGGGLPITEFGYEQGYTNQIIPELET